MNLLDSSVVALIGVVVGAVGAVLSPLLVELIRTERERKQREAEREDRAKELRAKRLAEFSLEILEAMRAGYPVNGPNVESARVQFVRTLVSGEAEIGRLLRRLVKDLEREEDPARRLDLHAAYIDPILEWLRGDVALEDLKLLV